MKKYIFNVDNQDFNVEILNIENGYAQVSVNNEIVNIKIKQGESNYNPAAVTENKPASVASVKIEAPSEVVEFAPAASVASHEAKVVSCLKSPLPGILVSLKVKVGDRVKVNDDLLVLDAMKMENIVTSECDGVVLSIKANIGQAVMQDDILIEFGA
jgi:biotin carboxyl carrier protein